MSKAITVSYFGGVDQVEIPLSYVINMTGNVQTIACSVSGSRFPNWLQLRKFEMSSLKENNIYTPLYSEVNNNKNMDTGLFIDKVYTNIMLAEKLKVRIFANDAV